MGWFDVVAGIATGGLYTIGKAAYQAGNAAESAGNAAEEAGLAVAVIGSTIEAVGEQLVSTLKEAEELLTINRLTPRSEADLWDEEKARLNSLRQEKTKVENELKALGVMNPSSFSFNFWDLITNPDEVIKKFQLLARLAAVNKEIQDIFYQEPGVLTMGIYNAKESLERFNTIEQPMIEDILASLDDNLDVSEEILQEIKKLFVTSTKIEIPVSEQDESLKNKLDTIRVDKQYYNKLLTRKDILTSKMSEVIRVYPENVFQIGVDSIRVPHENVYASDILDSLTSIGNIVDEQVNTGTIIDSTINQGNIKDDLINAGNIKEDVTSVINIKDDTSSVIDIKDEAVGIGAVKDTAVNTGTIIGKSMAVEPGVILQSGKSATNASIVSATGEAGKIPAENTTVSMRALSGSTAAVSELKASASHMSSMQPYGARISASLSTKFDGYQRNYDLMKAQKAFYARQSLKLDKQYEKLANKWVEVPGVIPGTLEELHGVLKRVRTEEQPRIDMLLDNLNANLTESKEAISKANETMESVQRTLSLLDTGSKLNTNLVKIGAMVVGGLVVLNLFVGLMVLIRMALGM